MSLAIDTLASVSAYFHYILNIVAFKQYVPQIILKMDDEFFEEDFSETPIFTEDEPKSRQTKKTENNSVEILTMENVLENILEMVEKVQQFFMVSICNKIILLKYFVVFTFSFRLLCDKM